MMSQFATAVAGATIFFAPLSDNYVAKPNGAPTNFDTGQFKMVAQNNTTAGFQVTSGKLAFTPADAGVAAAYEFGNIGKSPTTMTGTFVLAPGTGGITGSADFIAWLFFPNGILTPDTGFHISISRIGWVLNYASGGVQTTYDFGTFGTALRNDGVTPLTFSVTFDTVGGYAYMTFPDGSTHTTGPSTHLTNAPGIGPVICFESYQGNSAADDRAAYISVSAN